MQDVLLDSWHPESAFSFQAGGICASDRCVLKLHAAVAWFMCAHQSVCACRLTLGQLQDDQRLLNGGPVLRGG